MPESHVDFSKPVRPWDGFGVNYVEAAQTRDYAADPQEYGGLSTLPEARRQEVLDLIFGDEGLRPGVLKMFLDPWHQAEPGGPFDHETTTRWMRTFAREGLERTRARGGDLDTIVTLYGPPAWATKQRTVRGRDFDPARKADLARYLVDWARCLRHEEGIPVRYVSLHNEGEDRGRWPEDGRGPGGREHDYNLYWPPEQVVEFIKLVRAELDRQGLTDVGVAPGETTLWARFADWGYAEAIASGPEALAPLGLITSHGFGGHDSRGVDLVRARRPELHAWTTSMSWGRMDADFVDDIRRQICVTTVNACIPWACIQWVGKWIGGDPNPGTAFRVGGRGGYEVTPGYHFYKQVSRAGQPGMSVCEAASNDADVGLIAFGRAATDHPDALVVINTGGEAKDVAITVTGTESEAFEAWRTAPVEHYVPLGTFAATGGRLDYAAPPGSATTFFGR